MNPKRRSFWIAGLALSAGAALLAFAPAPGRGQDARARRQLVWEYLPGTINLHRAKVPGGWLLVLEHPTTRGNPVLTGCTFYPDPRHVWDGGSLP